MLKRNARHWQWKLAGTGRVATFEKNCGTVREMGEVRPFEGGNPRRCPHVKIFHNFHIENHVILELIIISYNFGFFKAHNSAAETYNTFHNS